LSDVQVFLFMEAAQGDQRTHVMQAPKLTMFNGQTATITVADQQFFTSDLNVIIIGTQIAFATVNTLFPTGGVTMFIRAAISGDRRAAAAKAGAAIAHPPMKIPGHVRPGPCG
jgi:hypothetical protein